jgi:hypothetical protein
VWRTHDGKYEICRHLGDPHPQRWYVFDVAQVEDPEDEAFPLNEGMGHVTLGEAVEWLEREMG